MEVQPPDYFSYIPNEVILTILLYLPSDSKINLLITCRRLHTLCSAPALWKAITWKHLTPCSAGKLRSTLKVAAPSLRSLRLNGTCLPSKYWKHLLKCGNLEVLEVFGGNLTLRQLRDVLRVAPRLLEVGFDVGKCQYATIDDYLALLTPLKRATIRVSFRTLSLPILTTWSQQGYRPQHVTMVDLDGGKYFYLPFRLLVDPDLGPPTCASHKAVFKVYHQTSMPLDLLPVPPILEYQFNADGSADPLLYRTSLEGNPDIYLKLTSPSDTTMAARYHPGPSSAAHANVVDKAFSQVAGLLVNLDLRGLDDLVSDDLYVIGEMCSNLKQLVLDDCFNSLMSLDGIRKVAQCCPLSGLSLRNVVRDFPLPCTLEIWTIVSYMPRLTHLAIEGCLLLPMDRVPLDDGTDIDAEPLRLHSTPETAEKLSLVIRTLKNLEAIHVNRDCLCHHCSTLGEEHIQMISNLVGLRYLRLENLPYNNYRKCVVDIFTNCRALQYVYISKEFGQMVLPVEAAAYANIQQLHLEIPHEELSNDCINALVSAGKLTHLFLVVRSMSSTIVLRLARELRRLAVCHVNVYERILNQFSQNVALKELQKTRCHPTNFVFKHNMSLYPRRTYGSAILSTELIPLFYGHSGQVLL